MNIELEELIPVVAKLADKYTGKESTSITYERAGRLMEAVLYCIREYELYGGEERESYLTNQLDAEAIYGLGYELVVKKVKRTKQLYNELIPDFKFYGNRCCYDTFAKDLPFFFLYYDPRFEPQNHIFTMDYPVLIPVDGLSGIDAVEAYVKCARLEQTFLWKLPQDYIRHVLKAYSSDYEELIINIASITLRNILGCKMAGKAVNLLGYTREEEERLGTYVNRYTQEELEKEMAGMIHELIIWGYDGNQELEKYLKADMRDFSSELKLGVKNRH